MISLQSMQYIILRWYLEASINSKLRQKKGIFAMKRKQLAISEKSVGSIIILSSANRIHVYRLMVYKAFTIYSYSIRLTKKTKIVE